MKFSITNYNVVLFCESVIFCSAMAVSVVAQDRKPIDHSKCTLDYMRKIVMESCIRPHSYYRRTRHAAFINNPVSEVSVTPYNLNEDYEKYKKILSRIPRDILPVDSSIVIKRRPRRTRKRSLDSQYDFYFYYCCKNIEICENMDCF